jgi:LmbE family N-acetylglucosaminyl deacetylase
MSATEHSLRLLIIGAHPDDADYHAGGLAALYAAAGHVVKMVSLTSGDAGHHALYGPALAKRRQAEARTAGAVIGASYDVLDNHDGELLPSLENRHQVIRLIRSFRPDLLLTHRPNDYHPDHRYTSTLVCDAAYMVTVPAIVPDTPHLKANPVIAYLSDDFQKPCPFQPSVAIDVSGVIDRIVAMLHCHESQFYEWLPFNGRYLDQVPRDPVARREWLGGRVRDRLRAAAKRYRESAGVIYGAPLGGIVEYLEAFEACEYGAPLDEAAKRRLFGFLR